MKRLLCVVLFSMSVAQLGCHPIKKSVLQDVYREDKSSQAGGNSRRHAASADELLWTVHLPGCSGLLLTPTYVITAAHCKPLPGQQLRSGWSILTKGSNDLEIKTVAEQSIELDYSIIEVRWLTPIPQTLRYPPRVATSEDDVYASARSNDGDEIFTVGFPDDRDGIWPSTYAEGQAKIVIGSRLYFNIGTISGNSGGSVLKKETHMLVALVSGGPSRLGEEGWDSANKEDAKDWNWGSSLWSIYSQSDLLKKLFPDGANAFYGEALQPKTQIFVAVDGKPGDGFFWLAASQQTEQLLLCRGMLPSCSRSIPGSQAFKRRKLKFGRSFFEVPELPAGSAEFTLTALDGQSRVIGQRSLRLEKSR